MLCQVESLLGSYLKDVGITEEQFMTACVSSSAQRVPEMQVSSYVLCHTNLFHKYGTWKAHHSRMCVGEDAQLRKTDNFAFNIFYDPRMI